MHRFCRGPATPCRTLLQKSIARSEKKLPGHLLTGPIRVAGAKAGQVLQVDIESDNARLGIHLLQPSEGALPYDDIEDTLVHTRLDADAGTGTLP